MRAPLCRPEPGGRVGDETSTEPLSTELVGVQIYICKNTCKYVFFSWEGTFLSMVQQQQRFDSNF
jgi:surface polysaccharide O-acyltransferase-like enzyme